MIASRSLLIKIVVGLVMIWGFLTLGYQIPREDFLHTILLFALLFCLMILGYFLNQQKPDLLWIFIVGFAIRISLVAAVPSLSDDYPRFLWDGELLSMQKNPYLFTPDNWLEAHPEESNPYLNNLHQLMNSPGYFSVYPPLNQLVFLGVAKLADQHVFKGIVLLRFVIVTGEILCFFLLMKLFMSFKIPLYNLVLYWFNPLVVLEITGNLHFEGLVFLCLLASLFFIIKNKKGLSGGFFGLAVGVKLLPLILIPAWIKFSKTRKSKSFWLSFLIAIILSFVWLIIDDSWIGFFKSLQLYQGKFEFNASIYYLLREVGYWIEGYNTIEYLSKILSVSTVVGIAFVCWRRKAEKLLELIDLWVLIYLIYLLLQPVVHPWYLIPGLGLSLFNKRASFLAWSFTVILSYNAYSTLNHYEKPIFLIIEYTVLFLALYFDYFRPQPKRLTAK